MPELQATFHVREDGDLRHKVQRLALRLNKAIQDFCTETGDNEAYFSFPSARANYAGDTVILTIEWKLLEALAAQAERAKEA